MRTTPRRFRTRATAAAVAALLAVPLLSGCTLLHVVGLGGGDEGEPVAPAAAPPAALLAGPMAGVGELPAVDGRQELTIDGVAGASTTGPFGETPDPSWKPTMTLTFPDATEEQFMTFLAESAALGYDVTSEPRDDASDAGGVTGHIRRDGEDIVHASWTATTPELPGGIFLTWIRDEPFPFPEEALGGIASFVDAVPGTQLSSAPVRFTDDMDVIETAEPSDEVLAAVADRPAWTYSTQGFPLSSQQAFTDFMTNEASGDFGGTFGVDAETAQVWASGIADDGRAFAVRCMGQPDGLPDGPYIGCTLAVWPAAV